MAETSTDQKRKRLISASDGKVKYFKRKNEHQAHGNFQFRKTPKPRDAVIICVSSRALFDMQEGRKIQDTEGLDAYLNYMVDNEDTPLAPGPAFGFVQALENVNLQLLDINENEKNLFDVVLAWDY